MSEIIALRGANSKTFDLGNNRRRTEIYPGRVHWFDGNAMQDYAPVWSRSGNTWSVAGMPFQVSFTPGQRSYTYTSAAGSVTANLLSMGGTDVGSLPLDFSNFVADSQRLGFFGILPELDMYFVAHVKGVSLHKILHGDLAPREFVWEVTKNVGEQINVGGPSKGAENLDGTATRETIRDRNRWLEFDDSFVLDRTQGQREIYIHTQRWTGRVATVDAKTRLAGWTTDFAYPVRIV